MSAAVGAALKKILVAILTEPKVLKNILFAILVVVVAMILPTVFVASIFSGDFEVDTASLQQYVEDNLAASDIVLLTNVQNTMEAIEEAMIDGYPVRCGQNQSCQPQLDRLVQESLYHLCGRKGRTGTNINGHCAKIYKHLFMSFAI